MEKNTLDHLLQIEAQAAALVNDAQAEAERRIHKSDDENRTAFEENYKAEADAHEASLKKEIEKIKTQYQNELDQYRKELSAIEVNTDKFSALLNDYLGIKG